MAGPLAGLKVVDLTRVLAGPTATQTLGDFGADVIKIEHPVHGDDTRKWGPPFVQKPDGSNSSESAYYLSANRSKRSVALDIKNEDDLATLKNLISKADILVENFKVGGLKAYGLDYDTVKSKHPTLIYASLTGFGQTGPAANKAGYDVMIQAMGGIMSVTGPAEDMPYKTGVAIADLMAGQYLLNGILAALYHRTQTGEGQHIDVSLFETQLAWLANLGQYYHTSGKNPPRVGNAHNAIVPYECFEAADGHLIIAVGNDSQFQSFCDVIEKPELGTDEDYKTNPMRVKHRTVLLPILREVLKTKTRDTWIPLFEKAGVPCGPVNTIAEAFDHPQTKARDMVIKMDHPYSDTPVALTANPVKFGATSVQYSKAPPTLGAHNAEVIEEWLNE